jgi:Phage terminase, small subunit
MQFRSAGGRPIVDTDMSSSKRITKSSPAGKPANGAVRSQRPRAAEATAAALAFVAEAEMSLAEFHEKWPTGVGALERALTARLGSALAQLRACAEQVAEDGLVIAGSMGQLRPHPLLKTLADLRREVADGLKEVSFRISEGARIEQANRIARDMRMGTSEFAKLAAEVIKDAQRPEK